MQAISMERIREIDASHGAELMVFRRELGLLRKTFDHDDNTAVIKVAAVDLELGPAELSSYLWLQTYLEELASSCDDVPSPLVVAQQFEIPWGSFEEYFLEIGQRQYADDLAEGEEAAAYRELTADELEFLDDLRADAEIQGE